MLPLNISAEYVKVHEQDGLGTSHLTAYRYRVSNPIPRIKSPLHHHLCFTGMEERGLLENQPLLIALVSSEAPALPGSLSILFSYQTRRAEESNPCPFGPHGVLSRRPTTGALHARYRKGPPAPENDGQQTSFEDALAASPSGRCTLSGPRLLNDYAACAHIKNYTHPPDRCQVQSAPSYERPHLRHSQQPT